MQSLKSADSRLEIVYFIQAKIFLAELLFNQNRNGEIEKHLREAIELSNNENPETDLIEPDIVRAKLLLEKIRKKL